MAKATQPKMSFEDALSRLDAIVEALEAGEISIEQSLKLYEEGTKLAAGCSKILNTAEQKIIQLSAEINEGAITGYSDDA